MDAAVALAPSLPSAPVGAPAAPSFNREVAPILFRHCAPCHHAGGIGPFSLLSFSETRKHARQIVEVTQGGQMPPWLPDTGVNDFEQSRYLSSEELTVLDRWVAQGAPEGEARDLPAVPVFPEGWQLGSPDLVVEMKEPYVLRADGPDVYRAFVIPMPSPALRHVSAVEFDPGNRRAVHHAFIRFDRTTESRRADEEDPEMGFQGLHTPAGAQAPEGHFLSWQPGRIPTRVPAGMAWPLYPRSDLVLQLHLQPSGKPEKVRCRVGFFFTDQPPTNTPVKLVISSFKIDIPAGETNHLELEEWTLPADVDLLAVLPHAHFLGRELKAFATFPDGVQHPLLSISHWDFNWQGEFRYRTPLFLPKGTKLVLRCIFDNSTNNPRNPNNPPVRVKYGLRSVDEMAEFWLQVLPRRQADRQDLARGYQARAVQEILAYQEFLLNQNTNDYKAMLEAGRANLMLNRDAVAERHLRQLVRLQPGSAEARYYLGLAFRAQNKLPEARQELLQALALKPNDSKNHGTLGLILVQQGDPVEAERHFREALRIDPADAIAQRMLRLLKEGPSKLETPPARP